MTDVKTEPKKQTLLEELQGIVDSHKTEISLLPKIARNIITEILQFMGRLVRGHMKLKQRVDAIEAANRIAPEPETAEA